jgi:hypothetical protein
LAANDQPVAAAVPFDPARVKQDPVAESITVHVPGELTFRSAYVTPDRFRRERRREHGERYQHKAERDQTGPHDRKC